MFDGSHRGEADVPAADANLEAAVLFGLTLGGFQRFSVEAMVDGRWQTLDEQTTIGYKRIIRFDPVTTTAIRVNILASKACIALDNVGIY